jgi:hypothetical protein
MEECDTLQSYLGPTIAASHFKRIAGLSSCYHTFLSPTWTGGNDVVLLGFADVTSNLRVNTEKPFSYDMRKSPHMIYIVHISDHQSQHIHRRP